MKSQRQLLNRLITKVTHAPASRQNPGCEQDGIYGKLTWVICLICGGVDRERLDGRCPACDQKLKEEKHA